MPSHWTDPPLSMITATNPIFLSAKSKWHREKFHYFGNLVLRKSSPFLFLSPPPLPPPELPAAIYTPIPLWMEFIALSGFCFVQKRVLLLPWFCVLGRRWSWLEFFAWWFDVACLDSFTIASPTVSAIEFPVIFQSEQSWRDLDSLLCRRFAIASPLWGGDSMSGHGYNHFLLFVDGVILNRYRSLIERFLRAKLVYGSPHMNRAVSFEYMNHQLVWNEFSVLIKISHACNIVATVISTWK